MIRAGLLLLLLGACGVEGPPEPPDPRPERPAAGITISGTAEAGVSGTF